MKFHAFVLSFFIVCNCISFVSAEEVSSKESEQIDFAQGLMARGFYDMAVAEYQKFITQHPTSTYLEEAYLAIGESYFLAKDYPKALEAFNKYKELYSNSAKFPLAVLRSGQMLIQQNKFDEAMAVLTSVDASALSNKDWAQSFYFYLGTTYRQKNDTASALTNFQKAYEIPDASTYTSLALEQTAQIYSLNSQFEEAATCLSKAIESIKNEDDKGKLVYQLGEAKFLAGHFEDAVGNFRQVLDQYPQINLSREAFSNLLLADFNLKNYQQAIDDYQKYLSLIKENVDYIEIYFTAAGSLIELSKYDEAIVILDKILAFSLLSAEDKEKALLKKSNIFVKQKKYTEAMALIEDSLKSDKAQKDELTFIKAQGYYGMGDFQNAVATFKSVQENYPTSNFAKAAVLGSAHAYHQLNDFKQAQSNFYEYYKVESDPVLKSEALYYSVLMDISNKDLNEAVSRAEEYIKAFPTAANFEDVVIILGDLYSRIQQYEKAIALFKEQLAHPEGLKQIDAVYFLLGYNLQLADKTDEALENYAKVSLNKEAPQYFVSALTNSAVILISQQKNDQAAGFFDRIITELDKPQLEFKTYLWVCQQYLDQKKYADLIRIAEKADAHYPNQDIQATAYFKAEGALGLKDVEKALSLYEIVLTQPAKNSFSGAAHIGKGLALIETQKNDDARKEFEKAIEETPDDHTVTLRARYEIANLANSQKNLDEALNYYLLIGTIYQDNVYCPESLIKAGKILEELNRKDEALKAYKEVVEKYSLSPLVGAATERIAQLSGKN